MTNAESVDKCRIVARLILAMRHSANCGANRMKFITLTTVPYLLPFVMAELGDLRKKFTCWKLVNFFLRSPSSALAGDMGLSLRSLETKTQS